MRGHALQLHAGGEQPLDDDVVQVPGDAFAVLQHHQLLAFLLGAGAFEGKGRLPREARQQRRVVDPADRGPGDDEHALRQVDAGQRRDRRRALRIPALRPDVAVLDARLPDGNGIDVCRDVRAVDSSIKGLILTSYEDDEALFAAIMAGASGYVLKQIRGTDLVDAVRRVAGGQSLLDPAVTQRVLERIRNGVEQPRELASLTDQERRILEYVAEGLTNREIAGRMFLAEKTVKNYVSSLLAKLGLERRTQAAVLATRLLGEHPR
ncbi:response regulator transcription factor [Actinoplanes sp. NPDC051475]|uniref:response regulator transcription factor n=1 Tax=Actinoplanes sp. NPDC051475 TaxID=3157225 RepID=UPI00344DCD6A